MDFREFSYNSNHMEPDVYARIREDVRKQGFLNSHIFVSGEDILDGNHRWRIAQELGLTSQLRAHDLGDLSLEEKQRLNVFYNLRGTPNYYMIGLAWFYQRRNGKSVTSIAEEYGEKPSKVRRTVMIFENLPQTYLTQITPEGPFTLLHAYYFAMIDRSTRLLGKGVKLSQEDKTWIWEKTFQEVVERKLSVDATQALLRTNGRKRLQVALPDLAGLGKIGVSIWKPNQWIENVRHLLEEGAQLGTYRKDIAQSLGRSSRYSTFHLSIAYMTLQLLLLEDKEERVVLDPMMGMGIRVYTAKMFPNVTPIGLDISPQAIEGAAKLYPEIKDDISVADAHNIPLEDESVDIVFTCPPYWNLERYETAEGQLSDLESYGDFIKSYAVCMEEFVRVLKEGGWCAIVVSDFRVRKQFYPFAFETMSLLQNLGLTVHDIIVLDQTKGPRYAAAKSVRHHHTQSSHEYLLILRKDISTPTDTE